MDSTLIIDYLESLAGPDRNLYPQETSARRTALQQIGEALVGMEKVVQIIYEKKQRPSELQHASWIDRLKLQLISAAGLMEASVEAAIEGGSDWLGGPEPMHAPAWLDGNPDLPAPAEIVSCRNGLLHLPTLKLLSATPNFFGLNAVDFPYLPNAPEPVQWLKFLNQLWQSPWPRIAGSTTVLPASGTRVEWYLMVRPVWPTTTSSLTATTERSCPAEIAAYSFASS